MIGSVFIGIPIVLFVLVSGKTIASIREGVLVPLHKISIVLDECFLL